MQRKIIEKPERKRNRLYGYDYSYPNYYFLTICTKKRKYIFGKIKNLKMILNYNGKIIKEYWENIPQHFPDIRLDKFVIMPNHIHGIIEIVGNKYICSLQHASPHQQLIPRAIATFKSAVTRKFNRNKKWFKWQKSYHDRIIRTEEELNILRQYIYYNPAIWHRDRNNNENK